MGLVGSSFVGFRARGFWVRDGLLEAWLEVLSEAVSPDAPGWLLRAASDWRLQARTGFMGCVDAGLDGHVASDDRVGVVSELVAAARSRLVDLTGGTGYLPAAWLSDRGVGGEDSSWGDLDVRHVLQVADAFAELLAGRLDR